MIGPSMIEQLEDLRSLSTGQLKGMLGTPSPHASPVFIAMVLKEREDAEKRQAGREAAAQTAQDAPTVAHRLAGMQQPVPMSQVGAMAAPPRQPPMPQESQLAMAMSGATGQPPPQLPTVNAETGTSGAAMQALVRALQSERTRTASQGDKHHLFASERPPPPVLNDRGLAGLIAAIIKQRSEPERAYGGFEIPKDDRRPQGRGRMVAPARPVTAANGTQGRTVYAQEGSGERLLGGLGDKISRLFGGDRYWAEGRPLIGSLSKDDAPRHPVSGEILPAPDEYTPRSFPDYESAWSGELRQPDLTRLEAIEAGRLLLDPRTHAGNIRYGVDVERAAARRQDILTGLERGNRVGDRDGSDAEGAALAVALGEGLGATERVQAQSEMTDADVALPGGRRPWTPRVAASQARSVLPPVNFIPFEPGLREERLASLTPETSPLPMAVGTPFDVDERSELRRDVEDVAIPAAKRWWGSVEAKAGRDKVFQQLRTQYGAGSGLLSYAYKTPRSRDEAALRLAKLNELIPILNTNPEMWAEFEQDPHGYITAALAGGEVPIGPPVGAPEGEPPPTAATPTVAPLAGVPIRTVGEPGAEEVKVTSTEEDGITVTSVDEWPQRYSETDGTSRRAEDDEFGRTTAALRGRLTALEKEELPDVTGQASEFYKNLTDSNKKFYADLETGLGKLGEADAKDYEKLEARFKALDDFYETGKLPPGMQEDRKTNLMLEMSKAFLGNQDLYSAFKAGIEGFQAVDKASRDEYAKGLSARLTAMKGIIDSKMAIRNSRRQEAIAMTQFAVQENRGNADLAIKQLEIAQQAKQNARTHEINLIRAEAGLLQGDAAMAAAMKPGETERLLRDLPGRMYAGALAKAKAGDRTELDKFYYRDSQGRVHPNILAFMSEVSRLKSTGAGALSVLGFGMKVGAAQQDIIADARREAGVLVKAGHYDPGWAEVAAYGKSIGVHPTGGPPSFDNWKVGATGKNKAWWKNLAEAYYRSIDRRAATIPGGAQNGAAQGEKPDPAGVRSGVTGTTN